MQDRVINLTFHGIGEPRRPLEPGEAGVWVSRETFASLVGSATSRGDIRISFDDGNASDAEVALPLLCDRGLRATFFVVAERIGAPRFLDTAALAELAAAGMEIGCHGMSHRAWRELDEPALRRELRDAKALLEEVVRRPVVQAACPFGSYDRRVLRTLRATGYRHVFTSDRGLAHAGAFLQPRNSVGPGDGPGLLETIERSGRRGPRAMARRSKLTVKRWR